MAFTAWSVNFGHKTEAKVTFFCHIFITFDKTDEFFVDKIFDI